MRSVRVVVVGVVLAAVAAALGAAPVMAQWPTTCGVRTDGTVECWGDEYLSQAPAGTFAAVSAGVWHTCGIRTNGTVSCWFGDDG